MKQTDDQDHQFYNKVVKFLTDRGINLSKKVLTVNSGHYGVVMKGDFDGYSLLSLIYYVARIQGKKIRYEED